MPPSLLPLAYSLIGALLAIAAMWGRNSEQLTALRGAVEKLTAKIETLSALEKADALHAQEVKHLSDQMTRLEGRLRHLEELAHATPLPGARIPR
jgi:ubiquinone biosynthesis protein UbiJ